MLKCVLNLLKYVFLVRIKLCNDVLRSMTVIVVVIMIP